MDTDEPPVLPPGGSPQIVANPKWIRGVLGGRVVVDSRRSMNVWELPYWPWWFFPVDDIAGDLVASADPTAGGGLVEGAVAHDLIVNGEVLAGAARAYPDHPNLAGLAAIDFDALDHWFEEDIEVFVHPRSPYTRIDALASSRHVVVSIDGVELANSHKPTVLFETGAPARHYLPMTDVRLELLTRTATRASCPYKGDADFFSVRVGDRLIDDIAWTYVLPRPESTPIAGLVCFYDEAVDVDIDGERQQRPVSHFR